MLTDFEFSATVSPPEAQCVFADFGSPVSSVDSVMGMSFWEGSMGLLCNPLGTS